MPTGKHWRVVISKLLELICINFRAGVEGRARRSISWWTHLGCLDFGALVSKAAVNVLLQALCGHTCSFLSGFSPRSGISGLCGNSTFNILGKLLLTFIAVELQDCREHLSFCELSLPLSLSICLCLSLSLSLFLCVSLSFCNSLCRSISVSLCLAVCLCLYLSVSVSLSLSVSLILWEIDLSLHVVWFYL